MTQICKWYCKILSGSGLMQCIITQLFWPKRCLKLCHDTLQQQLKSWNYGHTKMSITWEISKHRCTTRCWTLIRISWISCLFSQLYTYCKVINFFGILWLSGLFQNWMPWVLNQKIDKKHTIDTHFIVSIIPRLQLHM